GPTARRGAHARVDRRLPPAPARPTRPVRPDRRATARRPPRGIAPGSRPAGAPRPHLGHPRRGGPRCPLPLRGARVDRQRTRARAGRPAPLTSRGGGRAGTSPVVVVQRLLQPTTFRRPPGRACWVDG